MNSLIIRALKAFVRDIYGNESWEKVLSVSDWHTAEIEILSIISDTEAQLLFESAAKVLSKSDCEVKEDLGGYLVSHPNMSSLRRLLRFGGDNFAEFLYSLDDFYERSTLALPDVVFPRLNLLETGAGTFTLSCIWEHPHYANVVVGILRGMADDYGALVLLEPLGYRQDRDLIGITVAEASFAPPRDFAIAGAYV